MRDLTNYPNLQSHINTYGKNGAREAYLLMLSNMNKDTSKNIDTTLYSPMGSAQTSVEINGDYNGYTGYIIIENEVLNVISSTYINPYTSMVVERSVLNTIADSHDSGKVVRDGYDVTGLFYNYSHEEPTEASLSGLFQTVKGRGFVKFKDETPSMFSVNNEDRLFDPVRNKYIYFF